MVKSHIENQTSRKEDGARYRDMLKKLRPTLPEPKVKPQEKYVFIEAYSEYAAAKWARYYHLAGI